MGHQHAGLADERRELTRQALARVPAVHAADGRDVAVVATIRDAHVVRGHGSADAALAPYRALLTQADGSLTPRGNIITTHTPQNASYSRRARAWASARSPSSSS